MSDNSANFDLAAFEERSAEYEKALAEVGSTRNERLVRLFRVDVDRLKDEILNLHAQVATERAKTAHARAWANYQRRSWVDDLVLVPELDELASDGWNGLSP